MIRVAQTGEDEFTKITAASAHGAGQFVSRLSAGMNFSSCSVTPTPMVRRNAALALVRFHDTSGLGEIRAILHPYAAPAAYSGKLIERLKPLEMINPGALLGWVQTDNSKQEMRSQVPGTIDRWLVGDGAAVTAGQPVVSIDPSPEEVWEALRALYLIGQAQDLPAVEQFASGGDNVPANVRQQAATTADAIRSRK